MAPSPGTPVRGERPRRRRSNSPPQRGGAAAAAAGPAGSPMEVDDVGRGPLALARMPLVQPGGNPWAL